MRLTAVHTLDLVTHYRLITDSDIHDYSNYVSKLAAIAAPGDPPPARFRTRFLSAYGITPCDELVHDKNAASLIRNQAPTT